MPEEVLRNECNQSMQRVHVRIDEIRDSSIRTEESAKKIEKFVEDIHRSMYGNGKDGLITKVSNIFTMLKVHWGFIWLIIGSILTLAFFIIRTTLYKG